MWGPWRGAAKPHPLQTAKRRIFAPIGWFQQLIIHVSPLFEAETTLQFGKVTLIIGGNDIGKGALCDWLADRACGGARSLLRAIHSDHAASRRWNEPTRYGFAE